MARATYTAVAIIALFYAVSSWAMTVGTGPSAVVETSTKEGPDLIFNFLGAHGAVLLSDLAQLLFVTSLFAAPVSSTTRWPLLLLELTNDGAMGLVLLMTVVSLAVTGFFRRRRHNATLWSRLIAPALGFVLLAVVFVLILVNFNVLLGQTESSAATFILPALIVAPGLAGIVWGLYLRKARPELYRAIGHGEEGPVHLAAED